jgi:GNAT superfamily N-acetyltransferase
MMAVEVREVRTPKELRAFVRFPLSLYRGHPCYVPTLAFDDMNTLSRDKNPAFEYCEARCWLATKDGKIAGRVAAILNHRHIEKWNQPYLRFGWLDFIDDREVSAGLMEAVEVWAREKGMTSVHGPLGFTDMDREGLLVEGFDELGTMATLYNYPYYPQHLEALGYCKDTDWMEYELTIPPEPNETIAKLVEAVKRRYKVRLLEVHSKKELITHAPEVFEILNDEYKHLYGTVELSEKQTKSYIQQYFGFIDPEFVPLVVDETGRLIAFGITMPSLSHALQKSKGELFPFGWYHLLNYGRGNERADLYLVAVRSEWQGRGINAILIDQVHRIFLRRGIKKVETNPELETNSAVQAQWKYFEKRQHKRRRCYRKEMA